MEKISLNCIDNLLASHFFLIINFLQEKSNKLIKVVIPGEKLTFYFNERYDG